MLSFNITLPKPITSAKLTDPAPEKTPGYQEGFEAGYQAGQWKAQAELDRQLLQIRRQAQAQIQALQAVHHQLEQTAQTHLPQLVELTLQRLFRNHSFTPEETTAEISSLLRELNESQNVTIECAADQLVPIQQGIEASPHLLNADRLVWKSNVDLKPGEFRIQSDLGTVDGRHLLKQARFQAALEELA